MTAPKSVYIHIPFCSHKCHFCDFAAFAGLESRQDEYLSAILIEIEERLAQYFQKELGNRDEPARGKPVLETIFIGGGTPGLSPLSHLQSITQSLSSYFQFSPELEFSLETTPHAITAEKASGWRDIGINRLSIGVESFHDSELKAMGRDHSRQEALVGIETASLSGIDNICLDFMYGLPEQTRASFQATLQETVSLSRQFPIKHISAYGLEIAVNSPLLKRYPRECPAYPDEETFVQMFEDLCLILEDAGFLQYEVSNFAKPGFESRHNLTYWRNEPYFAFGVGAHRYVDRIRSSNSKSFNAYVRDYRESEKIEEISAQDIWVEGLMLALRLRQGLNLGDFKKRYGIDLEEAKAVPIKELESAGLIERISKASGEDLSRPNQEQALSATENPAKYLRITRKGLPVMNSIIGALI
ncbi:MAG: radical SAM family heme chaperone HemW [Candidatus Obscuribacterales bacterium]|nr:radical SAM family heme chaperone HemW [Candidatus Obscuribacterales bacterium]